ncbi:MAG: PGF-pre-PGF domain-containing protein, partial [Methanoregula sp.]|nr:PGF-pre-PGF domain-containing protein [Methanoregula sp.]
PGTGAGGTMTFAVNEPLSAGETGYSYAITAVSLVPAQALGSTSLLVTDAGATSHAPDGRTVAGIVAISPVAVNPSSISSGTITFAVSESWLTDHGLTPADIVLMRYHNGVWAELPTTYQYETGGACYFTATTPGFSYFAIAARTDMASANATVTGTAAASVPVSTAQMAAMTSAVPAFVTASPAGTSAPVTTATTAVPTGATGSSGIPVLAILAGIGGIAVVAVGAVLARRWWIRRQNPALFKEYD